VARSPLEPYRSTPEELRERLAAERRGTPFLVLRDDLDAQRIVDLGDADTRLTVGRGAQCDIALVWDPKISRLHAELERVGREWVVIDDGLSSNGTHIAGVRVTGRRRLENGDVILLGDTMLAFCAPGGGSAGTTLADDLRVAAASVTDAQRRVLIALCRPFKGGAFASPAGNRQIAEELVVSVDAVKARLKELFDAFAIGDLPQNEKRAALAIEALRRGVVTRRDL